MAKHGYGVPVDLSKCSNQPALYNRLHDKIIASTHFHLFRVSHAVPLRISLLVSLARRLILRIRFPRNIRTS